MRNVDWVKSKIVWIVDTQQYNIDYGFTSPIMIISEYLSSFSNPFRLEILPIMGTYFFFFYVFFVTQYKPQILKKGHP